MATKTRAIVLTKQDLREVTAFAAQCAQDVLEIFEARRPDDLRPRNAIETAWVFARGGERGKSLRDAAWAAQRAALSANIPASGDAALAAMCAASAAYLHPLANPTQVKHILGSAAYAARAIELTAGDDRDSAAQYIEQARQRATPAVVDVLERYPAAPSGGGRVAELVRALDEALRSK